MSALRSVTAAIVLLLLWSSVSGAQTTATAPIKIGWIGHLTGVLSAYGQDMLRAAEMAVEDVNASGGALGRKLELVVRDDRGDPSQAATLVRELDTQEHVLVLSGSMSADVSKALRGYAEFEPTALYFRELRRRIPDRSGDEMDATCSAASRRAGSSHGEIRAGAEAGCEDRCSPP